MAFQYITTKYYHTSTPYSIQFSYYNHSPPILLLRSSTQLDSSLKWKYHNCAQGTEIVSLPSDFEELHIEVQGLLNYEFHIPSNALKSTGKQYRNGFFSTPSFCGEVSIYVTNTTAQIEEVWLNESNVTNNNFIQIWYR